MKLVIETKVRENYGAHDWDGTGECPQYWKSKGGNEYVFQLGASVTASELAAFVESATPFCTRDEVSFYEYVTDWYVTDDEALTGQDSPMLYLETVARHLGIDVDAVLRG